MVMKSLVIFCIYLFTLILPEIPKVSGEIKMLDLAPDAFDDQYIDCADQMETNITSTGLLQQEQLQTPIFGSQWSNSENTWAYKKKNNLLPPLPQGFKDQYGIALLTYTGNGVYDKFNAAVRVGGQSQEYYINNFHFKTLHFYLTRAFQLLTKNCITDPQQVYRGVSSVQFVPPSASDNRTRFGQFTSTSLNKNTAESFGKDSFFSMKTCFGVQIRDFSAFPTEEEVLIPANEVFTVYSYTEEGHKFVLNSTQRTCSNYNCAYLGGKKARAALQYCIYNSAPRGDLALPGTLNPLLFSGFLLVVNAGVLKISSTW